MKDPKGPVKSYKTPEEIAQKHKVSLDKIIQQVKMGTKVEGEHTTSKSGAKITALQHVDELPDYYSKLKKIEKVKEGSLHQWFSGSKDKSGKPGWVNVVTGDSCASDKPGEGVPKCVSSSKRASMSPEERRSAAARKRRADPGQQEKSGASKPTYVSTDSPKKMKEEVISEKDIKGKGSGKKDACYHKVKARFKVWPSAYASGALVKCRQAGAKNWGNKSENVEQQYEEDTKYCLLCRKNEKREECSYGPMMWDRYTIAKIHPANESKVYESHKEIASGKMKDEEGYMANIEMDKIERSVQILRKIVKSPNMQLPAWVQSKITRAADFIDTAAEYLSSDEEVSEACWTGYKQVGMKKKGKKMVPNCVPANEDACRSFSQFMQLTEVAAWQRKEGKNPKGGLNEKGRKSYEAENPGSNLQAPQPEGGPRKRSFCARMGGMPGPMKDEKGRPTRKALALRKWAC
jgi:hypothetical protein